MACLSIVCLILADAQHATGFVGEDLYGRRIQFVLYSALFVFTWLGFRAFVGKAAPLAKSLGPILAFVLFILASDGMTSDMLVKYRLDAAINAAFGTAFCAAIVVTLMSDRLTRQLPMAWLAAFVYTLGVISMSMDFSIVVFEPLHVQDNLVMSETRIVNSLQNFILVSISAVSTILLLKERSEQRYRIASETDSLTGIANRRAFVSTTQKQLAKA